MEKLSSLTCAGHCPPLTIGAVSINHPAMPADDIAKLQQKGAKVYAIEEDMKERGIDTKSCLQLIQLVPRSQVAGILEQHDQVWQLVNRTD